MSESLYAYGVVESGDDFDPQALAETEGIAGVEGGTPIRTVDYRSLSAVVTHIDEMEPERTDENSRAHDDVLRTVLLGGENGAGRTVVPMRFGMTFKSPRTLKGVLRGGRIAFTRALNDVDGAVELGVKLVAEEGAELDREAIRTDVDERLSAVSRRQSDNDLFSDRLVLNRSFLVDRDEQEAFDDAVGAVREAYEDELLVQYNGPWAPYSFVDIEIGAEGR